eukprot:scaffold19555_cov112-Isochrysis_galbana.AAC.1
MRLARPGETWSRDAGRSALGARGRWRPRKKHAPTRCHRPRVGEGPTTARRGKGRQRCRHAPVGLASTPHTPRCLHNPRHPAEQLTLSLHKRCVRPPGTRPNHPRLCFPQMPFGSVFAHGACIRSGGGTWSRDLPNLPPLLLGVIGPNPARTGADPRQHGARLRTSIL